MTFIASKTALAAAVALTATVGLALPASAESYHRTASHHHHVASNSAAYRVGYRHGFRDGHYAAAEGTLPTGRSAYVDPTGAVVGQRDDGLFGNGGVLGTGVLGGDGVLGTGVLNGQGALGVGVLGF